MATAEKFDLELLCFAVATSHVHLLGRFETETLKRTLGSLRRSASHAIRDTHPGRVWARGEGIWQIRNHDHQVATYGYIMGHEQEGADVWSVLDRTGVV